MRPRLNYETHPGPEGAAGAGAAEPVQEEGRRRRIGERDARAVGQSRRRRRVRGLRRWWRWRGGVRRRLVAPLRQEEQQEEEAGLALQEG